MKIPTLEEILRVVKRSILNEEYIKLFPIYLQEEIRSKSKNYAGSNIEAIFNVVSISVHRHLTEIELNTKEDNTE